MFFLRDFVGRLSGDRRNSTSGVSAISMLRMQWIDLAFLHWRVPPAVVRELVPSVLELDTFHDSAWVAVTPFTMKNVHAAFAPPIPTASNFPELNVRTYVRHGGRAGVYFFSLDAASWLAVETARIVTGLPYFHAEMRSMRDGADVVYRSQRSMPGAPVAEFRARYRPTGDVFRSQPGSLEHFLTERYSLFVKHLGRLLRLDIEHEPWPLQPASAEIEHNSMADAAGIALPAEKPYVLFSRQLQVEAHWPVSAD
jgi:uncharacterized protein YqjF (DUF2071 family)